MKKNHQTRYKKPTQQFDVRVFIEPEDERTEALYTLAVGKQSICISTPLRIAVTRLQSYLAKRAEVE
jgi:hypothetical protein